MVLADSQEDAQKWQMTLFTEYTSFLFILMGAISLMLLILSIILGVMYKKERDAELRVNPIIF